MATVTSASEIEIARPPSVVWELLAYPAGWPSWAPHVRDVRLHGPVAVGASFVWSLGRTRIRAQFSVVDPKRELSWTGAALWTRAEDRTMLSAIPGGTRVVFSESLSGVGVRLLVGEQRLRRQHRRWLEALRVAAESR